jgi:hypothetical protein
LPAQIARIEAAQCPRISANGAVDIGRLAAQFRLDSIGRSHAS